MVIFFRARSVLAMLFFVTALFGAHPARAAESLPTRATRFHSGQVVAITEPQDGDTIIVGNVVRIEAPIYGDLLVAAQTLTVDAEISGSVRAAVWTTALNAPIGRSVTLWTRALTMGEHVRIGGDLWFSADTAVIAGIMKGHVVYSAPAPAMIAPGTTIQGRTTFRQIEQKEWWHMQSGETFLFFKIVALFGLFVVGMVLLMLVRRPSAMVMSAIINEPGQSLLWGLIGVVATPLIALLFAATMIGIPLGMIVGFLWIVSLYIAYVFAAITTGFFILMHVDRHEHIRSMVWTLVLGGVVWTVLTSLPVVGWLVTLFGVIWALGAIMRVSHVILKDFNAPPSK